MHFTSMGHDEVASTRAASLEVDFVRVRSPEATLHLKRSLGHAIVQGAIRRLRWEMQGDVVTRMKWSGS